MGQQAEGPGARSHLKAGAEEESRGRQPERRRGQGRPAWHLARVGERPPAAGDAGDQNHSQVRGCQDRVGPAPAQLTGDQGSHQQGTEHGPDAVGGVQKVHQASAMTQRHVGVDAGIDPAGREPDQEGGEHERGEARTDSDDRQAESSDPCGREKQLPGSEAPGQTPAGRADQEEPGQARQQQEAEGREWQAKVVADRGPGHSEGAVRHPEDHESCERNRYDAPHSASEGRGRLDRHAHPARA